MQPQENTEYRACKGGEDDSVVPAPTFRQCPDDQKDNQINNRQDDGFFIAVKADQRKCLIAGHAEYIGQEQSSLIGQIEDNGKYRSFPQKQFADLRKEKTMLKG